MFRFPYKILFPLILSLHLVFVGFTQAQQLVFEESEDGVRLLEDGKPRFFYQKKTKSLNGKYPRAHYFHPVYDLDGGVITEDFPSDHLHQRGIYWAWHQLYEGDKRLGNGWVCENFVWDVRRVFTAIEDNKAYLKSVVFWLDDAGNEYVVESMEVIYERTSSDSYELDFDIKLQGLKDNIYIGGSEDSKGYGGFSIRLKLPDPIIFEGENGRIIPKENAVLAGNKVSMFGKFNDETDPYYVTVTGNTEELPSYQGWILREKNSMQNMAFPGRKPIQIPHDNPLGFQHKIIVHRKN
ncbi:DUF6807 family protein [Aquiflexum sp.]|uniref:DUF6807 family protein n=1 Tax=Aquiflexum sp. TaxID=1872584 RepID=UPI0035931B3D